ncbi:MAG TPA: isoprenyl transferase, partial [Ruminococcus sp.]|nr:isoprenyl transferase [Ruminococcus sp.]
RKILRRCGNIGIECVSFYAFSTENWKRSSEEVSAIMKLFNEYLDD